MLCITAAKPRALSNTSPCTAEQGESALCAGLRSLSEPWRSAALELAHDSLCDAVHLHLDAPLQGKQAWAFRNC